jgi:hypothetical protein
MAEQQPHVEVFSRNKIRNSRISFIAVAIPVTFISGLVVYALLPFILLIGYGLLTLAAIVALYLVALLYLDIKRRALHAKVVHLGEYGAIDAENWRMLPLALPPPQPVTVTAEDPAAVSKWEDEVRDCYNHGQSEETLSKSFNVTRHQIRKILGKA